MAGLNYRNLFKVLEMNSKIVDSFRGQYKVLSNFYTCNIKYYELSYSSVENAYQASKTNLESIRRAFMYIPPEEAKRLGRKINLRKDWEEIRLYVMADLLKIKFTQAPECNVLHSLQGYELIEGNHWHDNFWGNCTCPKCEEIEGQNHLGKLLMKLAPQLTVVRNVKDGVEGVLCDRTTEFGNNYRIGCDGNRAEVIKKFLKDFDKRIHQDKKYREKILALRGSCLLCHCYPSPCHVNVIANWLNHGIIL